MSKNLLNVLLIISSFAICYLVIIPLYSGASDLLPIKMGISDLSNKNSQYDQAIKQVNDATLKISQLQTGYMSFPNDVKQMMNIMVPDSIEPVRLMSEVNSIANKSGLMLQDVSASKDTSPSSYADKYSVSFSVSTTYDLFKALMAKYETSLRLFNIDAVSFSAPQKDGDLINFQVKLSTFYIK